MPRRIAPIDRRRPRVIALAAPAPAETSRLTAWISLLVITFLSVTGWAVIGGLAYWAFR